MVCLLVLLVCRMKHDSYYGNRRRLILASCCSFLLGCKSLYPVHDSEFAARFAIGGPFSGCTISVVNRVLVTEQFHGSKRTRCKKRQLSAAQQEGLRQTLLAAQVLEWRASYAARIPSELPDPERWELQVTMDGRTSLSKGYGVYPSDADMATKAGTTVESKRFADVRLAFDRLIKFGGS